MMLFDVCLTSVAYIGPKSRTQRPRKTKIGTKVAHVTRDSDITFKVRRAGAYCGGLPPTACYFLNFILFIFFTLGSKDLEG